MKFLRSFRRRPLRVFLTLIQVAVGSLAAMIALSFFFSVRQTTASADLFDLVAGTRDGTASYLIFEPSALEDLKAVSPDIEDLSIYSTVWGKARVSRDGRFYEFAQNAYVDAAYFDVAQVDVTRGLSFTQEDQRQQANVMLIADSAADILFGNANPVGQTLSVITQSDATESLPEPFQVVGTFAESSAHQYAYLPYWKLPADQESDTLGVLAKENRGPEARAQILSAAQQVYGTFSTEIGVDPQTLFFVRGRDDALLSELNLVIGVFGFFGAVACVVGALGIVSIMSVNVLERRRDIGVKRALGATRAQLMSEFTLESAFLSVLGGVAGVAVAWFVTALFTQQISEALFAGVRLSWQPAAALYVTFATLILGLLAGVSPALQAARYSVVEALQDAA